MQQTSLFSSGKECMVSKCWSVRTVASGGHEMSVQNRRKTLELTK